MKIKGGHRDQVKSCGLIRKIPWGVQSHYLRTLGFNIVPNLQRNIDLHFVRVSYSELPTQDSFEKNFNEIPYVKISPLFLPTLNF